MHQGLQAGLFVCHSIYLFLCNLRPKDLGSRVSTSKESQQPTHIQHCTESDRSKKRNQGNRLATKYIQENIQENLLLRCLGKLVYISIILPVTVVMTPGEALNTLCFTSLKKVDKHIITLLCKEI